MMKNPAGWLALIVLAIASLLMVFFVLPRMGQDTKPIGEAINAAGSAVKDAVTENTQPKAPEAPKPAEQAAAPSAPATAPATQSPAPAAPAPKQPVQQAAVTPSFDVLRVEPDGSAVIAGRAAPNSSLEVTNGSSTVAKTNAGPTGDFVAILDNPLPPGDHQLVLKATGKDGKATISEETATVSVPADKNGKLLAMVTTPGKASRLIATPEAAKPAAQPAPAPATAAAAAATSAPAAPQMAAAPAAPAATSSPDTTVAGLPALPAGSAGLASSAPNMMASAPAAAPAPAPVAAAPAAPAPVATELRVTAVEIEGSKIFVAGVYRSGAQLRGQADGKPIGTAQAGTDGSFVIEGNTELTVGDHKISVEALGAGGQVLVRVEVPFNRPAGDQIAAVAAAPAPSAETLARIDAGAFDKLRNETVRAFNLLRGLYDDGRVPSLEQMVAARSGTAIALRSLAEYRLPVDAAASVRVIAETTAKDAAKALAALDALPKDVSSFGAGLKQVGEMIAKAVGPVIAQQLKGVEMAAAAPPAPAAANSTGGAMTIQQAPLTQSERASVIIRRGDTLWQISRRVYGQGVRYTTIYLANEDQIRNPDVIQPGQIFGVPGEALPNSEELHRERMMHRRS